MKPQESEKSIELDGFIVIDKPKGPTSHQVDYWVRQILGMEKVGHVGTLDPGVTGVLVMALGKATKLIDIAHEQRKEYIAVMRLYRDATREAIEEVFKEYTDEVYQIPPMRSAVSRTLRKRRIYAMDILEIRERLVLFRVECDSGTYIRTLCTDMGYSIGGGAQMAELRRTRTGLFEEKNLVTLQDLTDAVKLKSEGSGEKLSRMVFPMDYLFRDHSKVIVKKSALHTIARGSDLFPGGIRAVIGEPMRGDRVAVLSENNELVGTGHMLVNHDEIRDIKVVDFDRILIENPDQARAGEKPAKKEFTKPKPPRPKVNVRRDSGKKVSGFGNGGSGQRPKFRNDRKGKDVRGKEVRRERKRR